MCKSVRDGYPLVMYVRSVETVLPGITRIKAESVLGDPPESTPASLFYRVPYDEAPRCGARILVVVEPFPYADDECWLQPEFKDTPRTLEVKDKDGNIIISA